MSFRFHRWRDHIQIWEKCVKIEEGPVTMVACEIADSCKKNANVSLVPEGIGDSV
jgi:hypothetical protein